MQKWLLFLTLPWLLIACVESKRSNETLELPPSPLDYQTGITREIEPNRWNLVTFPVTQSTDLATFLTTNVNYSHITKIWGWDASLGDSGEWRVYPQFNDFALLNIIEPNQGYWIQAQVPFTFSETIGSPANYTFSKGWNLVGHPHTEPEVSLEDFFYKGSFWPQTCGLVDPVVSVWAWDDSSWKVYMPKRGGVSGFNQQNGTTFEELRTLEPGTGFWINTAYGNESSNCDVDELNRPIESEVFYFVMPDRFNNGSTDNDTGGIDGGKLDHGFDNTDKAFYHGGDLVGLKNKLDYLEGLGVTAIWMTPIFKNQAVQGPAGLESSAYHGYWITDYTQIDPHLGTNQELKDLIEAAHAKGMKVFFDIITNW